MSKKKMTKKLMAGAMALTMATAMVTTGFAPMGNVVVYASTATNITFDTAEDLTFNTSIVEEMSSSDNVRYYKFTLDEASELNISDNSSGSSDLHRSDYKYFTIYDENRTEVCSYSDYHKNWTTGSIYLTGGNYYLKLQSHYNESFTVTKDSLMESFVETQTKNNDSFDDAYTISLSKQYKGVLAENDAKDYFKFEVPATGKVHVNIKNAIKEKAGNVETAKASIYDGANTPVYTQKSRQGEVVEEDVTLSSGTYYFMMTWNRYDYGNVGSYSFKLDYTMSSPKISSLKNSGKKKMTVKWGKVDGAKGYELQYTKDKNFKSGITKKTLKPSVRTVSYSKLAKGKTYYVRVRAYTKVNGKTKYSGWSSKKSVVIKK